MAVDSPTSPTSPISPTMPVRHSSTMNSDDIGDASDPLYSRFKTWRHTIGNLIEYFEQIESMNKTSSKEFLKLSKTLEVPFKTNDFAVDGISSVWLAMRDKAVQMSTFHQEEANIMKAGIISELTRLRADIKKHLSDLDKGGVQGSKALEKRMSKFSDQTQSLGKWIPVAETNPTSLDASHDPYVLHRQTRQKLYRAMDEENQLNEQLLGLQNRCQHYETLIVQAIQKAITDYAEAVQKSSNYSATVANEIAAIAIAVPAEKEWEAFQAREPTLLPQDHKPSDPLTATFPFHDHPTTRPILEARLDRKSTMLKQRKAADYVLTPSGFLHEFKDNDPIMNPEPTMSLKLADCTLGPRGDKGPPGFTIRGKDAGKSRPTRVHEWTFLTDNTNVAIQWWDSISKYCSNSATNEDPVTPTSPTPSNPVSRTTSTSTSTSPIAASTTNPISGNYTENHGGQQTETPMHTAPSTPVKEQEVRFVEPPKGAAQTAAKMANDNAVARNTAANTTANEKPPPGKDVPRAF